MLAAGLKKKEKRWRCSPVLRDLLSGIARPRIPRLGNSPFLPFFSEASSEDDDYTDPKAAVYCACT